MDIKNFTEEMTEKLLKEYEKAVQNKNETFIFEGEKVFTDYVKLILAFLRLRDNGIVSRMNCCVPMELLCKQNINN